MTLKNLLILVFAVIVVGMFVKAYMPTQEANSQSITSQSQDLPSRGGEAHVRYAGLSLTMPKLGAFDEKYMVFGMGTQEDANFTSAYVAGIPFDKALALLRKYPDMIRCNSPHADKARAAIVNIAALGTSSNFQKEMREATKQFNASMRRGGERICVRVEGEWLNKNKAKDTNDGGEVSISGESKIAHVDHISLIPCR